MHKTDDWREVVKVIPKASLRLCGAHRVIYIALLICCLSVGRVGVDAARAQSPGDTALHGVSTQSHNAKTTSEKPNIILILADDMGFSDVGAYGGEIDTPHLDRMAQEGLRFTQFYNAARCSPSRAALLTGLYPHQAGVGFMTADFGDPSYRGYLSSQSLTIAEALNRASYRTLMTGKWHVGGERGHWPRDRGFDRFYGIPKGGGVYFWPTILDRPVVLDDDVETPPPGWYSTDAFTNRAIEFMEEARIDQDPFFLYVSYIAPHWPQQAFRDDIAKYQGTYMEGWDELRSRRYQRLIEMGILDEETSLPPRHPKVSAWNEQHQKEEWDQKMAAYAAVVERMDWNIGQILDKVDKLGIEDNTLVLFLSDNGASAEDVNRSVASAPIGSARSFVSAGRPWANVSNAPFRYFKKWTYEGGIATPLIARWPGVIEPGRTTDAVGHVIDFMPTFLDMAGAEYPSTHDGQNLEPLAGESILPVLRGETDEGHEILFWEHQGHRAVRKGDWKLVSPQDTSWKLYNLRTDRTEMQNQAEQYPEKVDELIDLYEQLADRYGVLPWHEVDAMR